ncbi:amino acid aminotransferase [Rosenbergiella australiborealis]|uniref:Aspartate/tyrosine/aromatic aminotransferase n=2 Tax=Rosenbergiella TaxID=1356488 RepID=A0ABS5T3P2_9GAMM|nr:amino acid aminotransferase [Rosenbergiella australiborealis]MBT0726941.1 aspartate/tyrosine/aromatic aminotransferase [Rosenbergiella australiborealis]
MFESIPAAPADPILGLADLYKSDLRPNKINLGIGVYKDETGLTPVMISVKKAEQQLLETETSKNYLSIEGYASYAQASQRLLLGTENPLLDSQCLYTAQTPGGTGALRVAADFLAQHTTTRRVWVSNPTWPNHHNIFAASGLEVATYTYYQPETHTFDIAAMLAALESAKAGDVVVLHGCCHNPTGIDPTPEQWQQLSAFIQRKSLLPLFDFAYQGLGQGLDEDAQGLRLFAESHQEFIVCSSYSKNFGLYNERTGAFTLRAATPQAASDAFSQVKAVIRANYSNPPSHGAAVVATILNDQTLRTIWEQELLEVRQRIQRMRQLFVQTLQEKGATQDFSFINRQNGMFSFSGLTKEQVTRLREEFAIYAVASGRINIAGMTPENMSRLCESIITVTR